MAHASSPGTARTSSAHSQHTTTHADDVAAASIIAIAHTVDVVLHNTHRNHVNVPVVNTRLAIIDAAVFSAASALLLMLTVAAVLVVAAVIAAAATAIAVAAAAGAAAAAAAPTAASATAAAATAAAADAVIVGVMLVATITSGSAFS